MYTMPSKRPQNNITLNNIPVEYTYWRKRPNIARNNRTVKLPWKAYDARALTKWIISGQYSFPDNRQPITQKEMREIDLVRTVPRGSRRQYRLLMKKINQLNRTFTHLHTQKAELYENIYTQLDHIAAKRKNHRTLNRLYSQLAKLDANIKTTVDHIGSLNKMMNMLLRDEFRPVVSRSASPVVSRRASAGTPQDISWWENDGSPGVSRRASPVVSRRASPRRSHHASPVSNSNNA
jgi:hypothetical protein